MVRTVRAAGALLLLILAFPTAALSTGPSELSVTARQLALMPVPQSALGKAAASLPLETDAGVVTNSDAASDANGNITSSTLARLGRTTGYMLDYGMPLPAGGEGLYLTQSDVELYRSTDGATKGLALWRQDATVTGIPNSKTVSASVTPFSVGGLGPGGFAFAVTLRLKGNAPMYEDTIGFQDRLLVAQVSVGAGSQVRAHTFAIAVAHDLRTRITKVLAGEITGPPVSLPAKPKAGPPANGPKLGAVALSPTDLGSATVTHEGYQLDTDLNPVSVYERDMSPAGNLRELHDEVELYKNSIQANYALSLLRDVLGPGGTVVSSLIGGDITSVHARVVPVHVGDASAAVLGTCELSNGKTFDIAFLLVRDGSAVEFVTASTYQGRSLLPSAVTHLAKLVATRAEAGLSKPLTA